MKRNLVLVTGIATAVVLLLGVAIWQYSDYRHTKSFSPEDVVIFEHGDLKISVSYNRPYKKGRLIFGDLVPYDKVWRTGANEATIFRTNRDLFVGGEKLPAGTYSLWTIPREAMWTVIFNSQYGQWGINAEGEANREAGRDVLQVEVPAVDQSKEFEQFTITFEEVGNEAEMILIWNRTLVTMPFSF